MKINMENERIKRKHLHWLRSAKRYSEDTIQAYERAVETWEAYTHCRDFHRITTKVAGDFSDWVNDQVRSGKTLSASTRYQIVRLVRSFYEWLATQPGRSSKAITVALSYLSVERKTVMEASSPGRRDVPTLAYIQKLANSISISTELDRRDRALISFLLLSGARTSAVATLPLGCFDTESLMVYQDPKQGVKTKNGKYIPTRLFVADRTLLGYVLEWVDFLRREKLFGDHDPLFPRTRVAQEAGGLAFEAKDVVPVFWKSGGPIDSMVKSRALAAGLRPYHCHAFRHTIARLAMSKARSGEELKAISQNLGHAHFETTAVVYGHLDDSKVAEVMESMNFEPVSKRPSASDKLKDLARKVLEDDLTDED
ncbi:MAG: tyrosine-type recombinase/integrase [Candidatus Zixiibacteriota bacterium]